MTIAAVRLIKSIISEITADLLDEVVGKGIFTSPYINSAGWELWIDAMEGD